MNKILKILLWSSGFSLLAAGLFGPIYAVFVEEIGGDLLTAGAAYSVFAISSGIIIFFIGRWEDHIKHHEKLIVLGYGLGILGFIGYLLIKTPLDLFLVQIVFGVAGAVGTPAFDGLYSRYLDKGKYCSEWALWESMYSVVTGISALIGGYIANFYGFKVLFAIMLILSVIAFTTSLLLFLKKNASE